MASQHLFTLAEIGQTPFRRGVENVNPHSPQLFRQFHVLPENSLRA